MGVWLGPMPAGGISGQDDYSYTGTSEFYSDENGNWELQLSTSGTLRFLKKPGNLDVFLVGGGGTGGTSYYSNSKGYGGKGGRGGECVTALQIFAATNTNYTITVGTNGTQSNALGVIAYGGNDSAWSNTKGKEGGAGGVCNKSSGESSPVAGTNGVLAFGESGTHFGGEILFGASGGGGGTSLNYSQQAGGAGAVTGSGHGGAASSSPDVGQNATVQGTGAAGGGGGLLLVSASTSVTTRAGGAGGSGVVLIRNHRS